MEQAVDEPGKPVPVPFGERQAAFVTAFEDRDTPAFRKAVADLAWGSFAWCVSEPDHLIAFDGRDAGAAGLLHAFGKG